MVQSLLSKYCSVASLSLGAVFEIVFNCPLRVHCIAELSYGVGQQFKRRLRDRIVTEALEGTPSLRLSIRVMDSDFEDCVQQWWLVRQSSVPSALLASHLIDCSKIGSESMQPLVIMRVMDPLATMAVQQRSFWLLGQPCPSHLRQPLQSIVALLPAARDGPSGRVPSLHR